MLSVYSTERSVFVIRSALEVRCQVAGVGVGVAGGVVIPGWWKVLKGVGCMKSHHLMPSKNDIVLRKKCLFFFSVSGFGLGHVLP